MKNSPIRTWKKRGYVLSTDPAALNMDFVHRALARSYWSPGVPRAVVEKAAANSLVFGLYRADGAQVGYARLVTDMATFAYLADVIVTEAERGKGLGRWMNECIVSHPDLRGLRRWMLATRDAHRLYRRVGWSPLKAPERFMERHFPDVHRKTAERR
jgi:GNAT superfamily N-acetyltransferase